MVAISVKLFDIKILFFVKLNKLNNYEEKHISLVKYIRVRKSYVICFLLNN